MYTSARFVAGSVYVFCRVLGLEVYYCRDKNLRHPAFTATRYYTSTHSLSREPIIRLQYIFNTARGRHDHGRGVTTLPVYLPQAHILNRPVTCECVSFFLQIPPTNELVSMRKCSHQANMQTWKINGNTAIRVSRNFIVGLHCVHWVLAPRY